MSNYWKTFSTAFFVLLLQQVLLGQKTAYIAQLLDQAALEVFEPLDAGYRAFQPMENEYLNCQYAVHSNREALQIRYYVQPWNEADKITTTPHVATFRVLTSVASNADEAIISAIQPDQAALLRDFNADWGMVYFFQPKSAFAQAPSCKMLALSKEGQGTVFVFFLFEDAGNLAIDRRELAVRFR